MAEGCLAGGIASYIEDGVKAAGECSSAVHTTSADEFQADEKGNVQVDPRHLATPHDRTIPSTSQHTISAYSALRFATLSSLPPDTKAPLLIMQISHAGLQSSSTIGGSRLPWVPAIGSSSMRPDTGNSWAGKVVGRTLWPTKSRQIVDFAEWEGIVQKFVDAAVVAEKAGWEGVQVHSAHGYLLAEYLSPLVGPLTPSRGTPS